MTDDRVVAFRDPHGLRPLALGVIEARGRGAVYCVASESCAFDLIGARYLRDVQPGEVVTLDADGSHSRSSRAQRHAFCVFEYIYFARPDSRMGGSGCRSRAGGWARSSGARRRSRPTS
jgi:amidophosphoribosyltransferase